MFELSDGDVKSSPALSQDCAKDQRPELPNSHANGGSVESLTYHAKAQKVKLKWHAVKAWLNGKARRIGRNTPIDRRW